MTPWLPGPSVWLEALLIIKGADDLEHKLKGLAPSLLLLIPKVYCMPRGTLVPSAVKGVASLPPYFKPTVGHLFQTMETELADRQSRCFVPSV